MSIVETLEKEQTDQKSEELTFQDPYLNIKRAIWAYFLLIIFEGALRKWFLPSLATPLLVVRDPIAVYIIFMAWRKNIIPQSFYLGSMILFVIISSLTTLIVGHGNIPVTVYGARIFLIHFPLIFIIGMVLNRDDVVKMGKAFLWISIPMAVLIALQFYSPQAAWVNRGVGGDLSGAGFSGAMGYMRPPGTFSFTIGVTQFFGILSCFIFYFWMSKESVSKILLFASTAALLIAIPLSISRALLFHVAITLLFSLFIVARKPKYTGKILLAVLGGFVVILAFSQTPFFQTATEVFQARFEVANEVEGGMEGVLIDRFLGGLYTALENSVNQPLFGLGIGMGTNVGAMLLAGELTFLIAEGEWARIVGEMGPILGLGVIFIRVGLGIKIAYASFQKLSYGVLLPWLLVSIGFLILAQGQWAQPTVLGFSCFVGGITISCIFNNGIPDQK